ncbi:hypothetical protein NDU88_005924 [Pleurodeles waltl]|uniref:Uncharacterized protein n=1 Tax=Pleurodeles waltl TaxID=8319 RepID=A0AAV7VLD4_PLEWA|nr:hypothetical protein NDU88_005924 [Pleurodeles waltl]
MTHSPTGRYLWGTEGSTTTDHMPIHPDVLNGDWDTKEVASGEVGDGEALTGAEDRCEEEMLKEPLQPSKAMDNEVGVVWMAQMMEKIDLGKGVRKGVAVRETHQTGRGEDEGSRHVPGEAISSTGPLMQSGLGFHHTRDLEGEAGWEGTTRQNITPSKYPGTETTVLGSTGQRFPNGKKGEAHELCKVTFPPSFHTDTLPFSLPKKYPPE